MKYYSTRGPFAASTFEQALFSGYADDGGLLVPETIPQISPDTLLTWKRSKCSYPQIVAKIVRLFVPVEEIPDVDLDECISKAYQAKFTKPEIIPVKHLDYGETGGAGGAGRSVKIAELFHGPTLSFKDMGMSLIGEFMSYFLAKKNRHTIVLVGTSGDTGAAAMEAVRSSNNVDIIVLYPQGKISPVQELQLKNITGPNIHLYAVEGTSDDLDVPIKKCFPGENLCSINSINWARIMIQIAHYVYLYTLELENYHNDTTFHVIVPTGAAGNLVSGLFASKMGLPLHLHFATNQNDTMNRFLAEGALSWGGHVTCTPANAMDIGQPYNVERILHLLSNGNAQLVKRLMGEVEGGNVALIPNELLAVARKVLKGSAMVGSEQIYETIKACWTEFSYMVCPHTATALYYFNHEILKQNTPGSFYILATASPHKFPETAEIAGIAEGDWNGNSLLDSLKSGSLGITKLMRKGENWHKMLLDEINTIWASKSSV